MHLVSACNNSVAILSHDLTGILNLLPEQTNATLGLDGAKILDIASETEILNVVQEILIRHLTGSRHKNIGTNHGVRSKSNTCRVHEEDLAVGRQGSVQQGRISSSDPVQNGSIAVWLDELNRSTFGDIEVGVVNNRLLRGLIDDRTMRIKANEINLSSHHGRRRINGIGR